MSMGTFPLLSFELNNFFRVDTKLTVKSSSYTFVRNSVNNAKFLFFFQELTTSAAIIISIGMGNFVISKVLQSNSSTNTFPQVKSSDLA